MAVSSFVPWNIPVPTFLHRSMNLCVPQSLYIYRLHRRPLRTKPTRGSSWWSAALVAWPWALEHWPETNILGDFFGFGSLSTFHRMVLEHGTAKFYCHFQTAKTSRVSLLLRFTHSTTLKAHAGIESQERERERVFLLDIPSVFNVKSESHNFPDSWFFLHPVIPNFFASRRLRNGGMMCGLMYLFLCTLWGLLLGYLVLLITDPW